MTELFYTSWVKIRQRESSLTDTLCLHCLNCLTISVTISSLKQACSRRAGGTPAARLLPSLNFRGVLLSKSLFLLYENEKQLCEHKFWFKELKFLSAFLENESFFGDLQEINSIADYAHRSGGKEKTFKIIRIMYRFCYKGNMFEELLKIASGGTRFRETRTDNNTYRLKTNHSIIIQSVDGHTRSLQLMKVDVRIAALCQL